MAMDFETTPSSGGGNAQGHYATQSDIEDLFGTLNVLQWSNLDNTTATADAARIARALAWADAIIDGEFRGGPYAVPLVLGTGSAREVTDWAAKLAGVWLYRSRGHREDGADAAYDQMESDVMFAIRRAKDGRRLDAQPATAPMPTCPTVL